MTESNNTMPKKKRIWPFFMALLVISTIIALSVYLKYKLLISAFVNPKMDRVNILVLGKGGIGHEAPDLTDTLIFASITKEKTSLISLPRDIWIPEIRAKLNSAYYWGKLPLAKTTVEKIVGPSVNYGLVIDFSGFKKIIDALGGIEVNIQNAFTDEKYPISGKENDLCGGDKEFKCRYEVLSFVEGKQWMNGETALKFVRSRNAKGDEGTDTARAARQQLVINAIKNKLASSEILFNPRRLKEVKSAVLESIETDMDNESLASVIGLIYQARGNLVSSTIPEDMLVNPPISMRYDNQYVFTPRSGTWAEIQDWIKSR